MSPLTDILSEKKIVDFNQVRNGRVCGVARNGYEIYVHPQSEKRPRFGDVWYCLLDRKQAFGVSFYVAYPMRKLITGKGPEDGIPDDPFEDQWAEDEEAGDDEMDEEFGEPWEHQEDLAEEAEGTPAEPAGFLAIGDDTLYSPDLKPGNYMVFRSFNGKHLEIIRDDDGDVPCYEDSISLELLDAALGCKRLPALLECEIEGDRFLLKLAE
jgi:hypothetical protein